MSISTPPEQYWIFLIVRFAAFLDTLDPTDVQATEGQIKARDVIACLNRAYRNSDSDCEHASPSAPEPSALASVHGGMWTFIFGFRTPFTPVWKALPRSPTSDARSFKKCVQNYRRYLVLSMGCWWAYQNAGRDADIASWSRNKQLARL